MKGSILHSTTSRIRTFLIVPSIVTALAGGLLTASFVSPKTTPAAEAAGVRAPAAVVNALNAKANGNRTAAGKAIRVAMAQRGDMYLWGAVGPTRFDCSGLMLYAWKQAGKSLPRTSAQQRLWTRTVAFQNKKPGDMTFYNGHVAMYVGFSHGQHWMIHAPRSGQPVQVVPLRTSGLLKVGRVR
jgi:cell wall-associated NlpC family hydrolase